MTKRIMGLASLLLAAATISGPAPAQSVDGAIVIFGNDTCPSGMICVRAPENERYRIPESLRGQRGAALAERWGDRAQSLEYAGASGVQSCSPVGAGGASGCFSRMMRARDEDNRRQREITADGPLGQ